VKVKKLSSNKEQYFALLYILQKLIYKLYYKLKTVVRDSVQCKMLDLDNHCEGQLLDVLNY